MDRESTICVKRAKVMYVAGITTHDLIDQHPPTAWALPDNLSMLAGFGSSLSIDLFGGIQSVPAAVCQCFDHSSELEQQLAGFEPRIGVKGPRFICPTKTNMHEKGDTT